MPLSLSSIHLFIVSVSYWINLIRIACQIYYNFSWAGHKTCLYHPFIWIVSCSYWNLFLRIMWQIYDKLLWGSSFENCILQPILYRRLTFELVTITILFKLSFYNFWRAYYCLTENIKSIKMFFMCILGDGGNDVSMIQAANAGIGIVGKVWGFLTSVL